MKSFLKGCMCLVFAHTAFAAEPPAATKAPVATVEQSVAALTAALISGDAKALADITLPALSYGHSSGTIQNQSEFIESLATGKSDFVTIKLLKQSVHIEGDVALVRHDLDATTNDSGKPGTVYLGVLLVWKNVDGQWKLLARQAFRYPS